MKTLNEVNEVEPTLVPLQRDAYGTFEGIMKFVCAESRSRTNIACSSDRCLDHLGYLGRHLQGVNSSTQSNQ